jgi:isoleucyl-tRNA synthetase
VHTAPAYGTEDFLILPSSTACKDDQILTRCRRRRPLRGRHRCRFFGELVGKSDLGSQSRSPQEQLAASGGCCCTPKSYVHSYMHCWRHKTPIIYRATTQWFAGMDERAGRLCGHQARGESAQHGLRWCAAIEATQFFPEWGKARLHSMIANRPDWTLSRQRQWGVPMPFFVHRETGVLHPRTLELLEARREARGRVRHRSLAAHPARRPAGRRRGGSLREDQATRSTSGSIPAPRISPSWAGQTEKRSAQVRMVTC